MKIYSKEKAKNEISNLVENFDRKIDFYKSNQYKEANLEDEYLKPLLRFLNWNVSNENVQNLANREVIVQAKATHNPNLAICVNIDKDNKNKFSFISGSIENIEINNKIVDILEGTMLAFDKRKLKYIGNKD